MDASFCFNCGRTPEQIPGWAVEAKFLDITVEEFAKQDGTYNSITKHFCCDDCYIRIGMPSSPTGWRAP